MGYQKEGDIKEKKTTKRNIDKDRETDKNYNRERDKDKDRQI